MTITAEQAQVLRDGITPGPWAVCKYDAGDRPFYDTNGPCPSVCADESDCSVVHWDGFKQEYWTSANGNQRQIEANARAIAAVPDMIDTIIAQAAEIARLTYKRDEAVSVMRCPEVVALVEAMRGAIEAIDAAYDRPDDHGRYSTRERAALTALEQAVRHE